MLNPPSPEGTLGQAEQKTPAHSREHARSVRRDMLFRETLRERCERVFFGIVWPGALPDPRKGLAPSRRPCRHLHRYERGHAASGLCEGSLSARSYRTAEVVGAPGADG
jgi:hypothetical protein